MASLGNALLGTLVGHSDAEKMFRPWWDSLEDFVIYGLIMLGLIVSPTTIFNGTPLYCTQCTKEGQCGSNPSTTTDPGFQAFFVKSYCTMTSLTLFTLYFPYILLLSALLLAGIERIFGRVFKTNIQIDGFYSLVKHEATSSKPLSGELPDVEPIEDTIHTVEIRESFRDSKSFFTSYLMRTIIEFFVAIALAFYMVWFGTKEIERDKNVYCNVHNVYYECAGIPNQFYMSVLFVALALLLLYLISTFVTICWLLCPCWGKLARCMRSYLNELQHEAVVTGRENKSARALMGELYEIYYENRDLRLMLDLLAATAGLASPLRVMALLDQTFRNECAPVIHSLERGDILNGESDLVLEFSESHLARHILRKMDAIQCLYTVQICPRTDSNSVEVVVFNKDGDEEDKFFSYPISYFRKTPNKAHHHEAPRKHFTFTGVDSDVTYTVKISLILNGKAIATTQKTMKAIIPETIEISKAALLAASQLNLNELMGTQPNSTEHVENM